MKRQLLGRLSVVSLAAFKNASTGDLAIRKNRTFSSVITVEGDLIFVKAGTNVRGPRKLPGPPASPPGKTDFHQHNN